MEQANSTTSRLRWICACGVVISVYSLYVKVKLEEDKNYRPMCDVNENISCSIVFKSVYGEGFGLGKITKLNSPNGAIGIVFYVLYFLSSSVAVLGPIDNMHFDTVPLRLSGLPAAFCLLRLLLSVPGHLFDTHMALPGGFKAL
ncbi:vitamin K epoxide reductase complex subunit 1 isoform X1 [Drosophila takahashii]|uniref:vitamin K epoxide reductase complex subunit 1 isoform X1 n=1 Tax=Drosophila takahashii TaxID=29030 RepID=UPI001CF91F4F|nr:vitamin K epoxide reductase complex subunit 1 isoform X1 [Drosophila takahashii]